MTASRMQRAQPVQRRGSSGGHRQGWLLRPAQQQNRQAQASRRQQLGLGSETAGIFAHHSVNTMLAQQAEFVIEIKWPAFGEPGRFGQWLRHNRINAAHQIKMLWRSGIGRHFQPADGEENPPRRSAQSGDDAGMVIEFTPVIPRSGLPGWAAQSQDRYAADGGRFGGMKRHHTGKRMGGIHQGSDMLRPQPLHQAGNTAKTADAVAYAGRYLRLPRAAGQRQGGLEKRFFGQKLYQFAGFAGAAKNEDAHG